MAKIALIQGPNLNLLGAREMEHYGTDTLEQIHQNLAERFAQHDIRPFQSNHEGALIDEIQRAKTWADGIVINLGAYTHTSYACRDAIKATGLLCVEVHLSQIYAREEFRHTSTIAPVCAAQVTGFGAHSYVLGVEGLIHLLAKGSR